MEHSIGKTIAELRKAKGWTQIELAEKLNVSDKAVSKWEKDNGSPSIEFFPMLAGIFGVSIDYLMTGNNDELKNVFTMDNKPPQKQVLPDYNDWLMPLLNNGIIVVEKLLESKIFEFIKKALNEYPIHNIEKLAYYFQQNDRRVLFQYAIDNNDNALADTIIKGKQEEIENQLLSYWHGSKAETLNINKQYLYLIENGKKVDLIAPRYGTIIRNRAKKIEEVIVKLQAVKQRIIDEVSLKLDKEKTIGDLTKEYFECELAKGNVDMVIIKLCVRLEAVLRSDYFYEGDFSEMLKKYCDSKLCWTEDDGWGYMVSKSDDKTIRLLNNLRIKRNSIVHSEKTKVELSLEDIHYCIDYICKMG